MSRIIGGVHAARSWSRYDTAQCDEGGMMTSSCWEDDDSFVDYVNAMAILCFVHRLFSFAEGRFNLSPF